MKNPDTNLLDTYIEKRLRSWGAWYQKCLETGLGYPEKSIETTLMSGGAGTAKNSSELKLPYNPEAEQIDELVNELGQYSRLLAQVICLRYTSKSSLEEEAKLCQQPLSNYKNNLRLARTWFAARLHMN